jgi:hypothetical protein
MGFSTFSGPLRAGTQRYGAAENTGLVTLSRTAYANMNGVATTGTALPLFNLPAGSKILNFLVEVTVAVGTSSSMAVQIGKTGTVAAFLASTSTGTSVARVTQATIDSSMNGTVAATDNIGTVDVPVIGTFTAGTSAATAGQIAVTVFYQQRSDTGAQNPTVYQN